MGRPGRDLPVLSYLLPPTNPFAQIFAAPRAALANSIGATLAEVVDLDGPLVVAFTRDDRYCAAFAAIPEERLDPTTTRELRRTPLADGIERLEVGVPNPSMACGIVSEGVQRRLVCAPDLKLLEETGRFLARLTSEDTSGASLRMVALRNWTGAFRAAASPGESEAHRLGAETALAYARDMERAALELKLTEASVELTLDQDFRGLTSPLTTLWRAGAVEQRVPDELWNLPLDSDLAVFVGRRDPVAVRASLRPYLGALVPDTATPDKHDTERFERIVQLVEQLGLSGAPLVYALGVDREALARRLTAAPSDPELPKLLNGWSLLHVSRPFLDWSRDLELLMSLDSSKSAKRADRAITTFKIVRSKHAAVPDARHYLYSVREEKVAKRKGPEPKPPVRAHDLHLFAAASPGGSWLAWSESEAVAAARLAGVLAQKNELASLPELATLREKSAISGGFVSVAAFATASVDVNTADEVAKSRERISWVENLPYRGRARVPFTVGLLPPDETAGTGLVRTRLSVRADARSISDAMSFFLEKAP